MPATAPRPPYWLAGSIPQPTDFNNHINNDITFLSKRPVFRAYQSLVQSIPGTATSTILTLDIVLEDTYSGWTSGASNKYTSQVDGFYLVVATYVSSGGSGAGNMCSCFLNISYGPVIPGPTGGQKYPIASTSPWSVQVVTPVYMNAGNGLVQPMAWQNTGGSLNTVVGGASVGSAMEIFYMGE